MRSASMLHFVSYHTSVDASKVDLATLPRFPFHKFLGTHPTHKLEGLNKPLKRPPFMLSLSETILQRHNHLSVELIDQPTPESILGQLKDVTDSTIHSKSLLTAISDQATQVFTNLSVSTLLKAKLSECIGLLEKFESEFKILKTLAVVPAQPLRASTQSSSSLIVSPPPHSSSSSSSMLSPAHSSSGSILSSFSPIPDSITLRSHAESSSRQEEAEDDEEAEFAVDTDISRIF